MTAVVEAKRRGYPVKLGIEVDYEPAREEETAEALAPYPWDYVLGSIHFLDGLGDRSRAEPVGSIGVEGAWKRYYESLAGAARSGLFDFARAPRPREVPRPGDRLGLGRARESLDGVAIEVSSAGLHKPHGKLYPNPALLEAARARNVPITLASDAHLPTEGRPRSRRAVDHARSAGYETVTVFDQARVAPGAARMSDLRLGLGVDAHRFEEGIPLVLAGVEFPGEPGLAGHSDGDVIAHALIDAILGAAGKGDIGELFPSPIRSGSTSPRSGSSSGATRSSGWEASSS